MLAFLRFLLPSMFHRRLALLAAIMVVVTGVLIIRLGDLTLARANAMRDQAESVLSRQRVIRTKRGRLLDRFGRVLAQSRATWQVSVRYPVLSGAWSHRRGRIAAWRANRNTWSELSEPRREQLAAQHEVSFRKQVDDMWRVLADVGRIDLSELESRTEAIKSRVQRVAGAVALRRLEQQARKSEEPLTFADVSRPIGEQEAAHPILLDIDDAGLLRVRRLILQGSQGRSDGPFAVWREVEVEPSKVRKYPLETMTVILDRSTLPGPLRSDKPIEVNVEGVGLHMIGWTRPVYREDVESRPFRLPRDGDDGDLGGYLPGDRTGRNGIEQSMEHVLRGQRGVVTEFLDTGNQIRREPVPGGDVVMTVDIRLQARIQALMSSGDRRIGLMQTQKWHGKNIPSNRIGQPLNGAAVVLDVSTGQILAAVTAPGISLKKLNDDSSSIYDDDLNKPYLFRPIGNAMGGVYQPGSTVKPLVLAAAITDGKIAHDATIDCTGHLDADAPDRFRCWIYKHFNGATHGPLDGGEATARSCNIFFYTLGRDLGARRLTWWYEQFGLGKSTGSGIRSEAAGEIPDRDRVGVAGVRGFSRSDAILLGIGQGPIRWTVLQAANSYATLARGGYMLSPTFVLNSKSRESEPISRDLNLDPKAVGAALKGLEGATNEDHGTAHHLTMLGREPIFNIEDVEVYGKSGTATAVPQRVDSDDDGRITSKDAIVRTGDHAWFIGFARKPRSPRPDFVIAVVVEYAGSGGAVAGPIANQILHAMRAEGHL